MPSEEALRLTTLINRVADIIDDIGVFPTANYATLAAFVEAVRTRLIDIETDTGVITWGDITGLVNDMGVFPTANYATLAAYVENIRTRLIDIETDTSAIVWGDITDINTLIDAIIADIGVFPTANYATLAAYVEDVRTRLLAIVADTGAITWGDITGLVNDMGVFPTANYATLAAYVENIRTRLIDIETDTSAIAWGTITSIAADITEGKLRSFRRTYAFVTTSQSVSSAAETSFAAPAAVTVTFPTGATLLEAKVVASLKANNQSAAEHNIGVTLQKNIAGGGWVDIRSITVNPPLTLPEVDATADALTIVEALVIATGQTVQFRWQVDSDNAGEVHYVQTFVLSVEYDFQ